MSDNRFSNEPQNDDGDESLLQEDDEHNDSKNVTLDEDVDTKSSDEDEGLEGF